MASIFGTAAADTLSGTAKADILVGRGGNDRLEGLGGGDLMLGGAGDDLLYGNSGTVPQPPRFEVPPLAGPGHDTLIGGPGDDTIFGSSATADTGSTARLILGGAGTGHITTTWGADTVLGGAGDDTIIGTGSADFTPPIPHNAFPQILSQEPADLLLGGRGADSIEGGGGADTLLGGPGEDTLLGGFGADLHAGGTGADLFVFQPLRLNGVFQDVGISEGNRDILLDFRQGSDRLDLSDYGFAASGQGLPAPVFLGSDPFIASFGLQVRSEVLGNGNTLVQFAAALGGAGPGEPAVPSGPIARSNWPEPTIWRQATSSWPPRRRPPACCPPPRPWLSRSPSADRRTELLPCPANSR
jgi:Ca2+-binding RTX toxin-like protein